MVEVLVHGQAAVRQRYVRTACFSTRGFVRLPVVHLLVRDRFALRRVANADAGHATEGLALDVPGALRLAEPAVDAAHELAADHAHFVQEEKEGLFESFL